MLTLEESRIVESIFGRQSTHSFQENKKEHIEIKID